MAKYKNPKELAQDITKIEWQDPFIYDEGLNEYDLVDYDKSEVHYPSEYDEWYKDREDVNDQLSFHPTKKEGVIYLMSNFMGDGFTTPDRIAQYIKQVTPYNKREWEKEHR